MKKMDLRDATASLAEFARDVASGDDTVVVTSEGRPIAALISLQNVDEETISLSTNPDFIAIIEHSRRRQEEEGGISSNEMRKRLGLD